MAVLAKNVIQPALCFALVSPLAMPREQTKYVVLLSAISLRFLRRSLWRRFRRNSRGGELESHCEYCLGIFTLAGWIVFLDRAH
jgi:hypothetical protein